MFCQLKPGTPQRKLKKSPEPSVVAKVASASPKAPHPPWSLLCFQAGYEPALPDAVFSALQNVLFCMSSISLPPVATGVIGGPHFIPSSPCFSGSDYLW